MKLPTNAPVYFDGSARSANCQTSSPTLHPTLYALQDGGGTSASSLYSVDFAQKYGSAENGYCAVPGGSVYRGIQAAPALQAPEAGGSDSNSSVWAFVACGPTLYRFDAQTGAPWAGNGASTINVGNLSLGQ